MRAMPTGTGGPHASVRASCWCASTASTSIEMATAGSTASSSAIAVQLLGLHFLGKT